jgi:hypothetical protein
MGMTFYLLVVKIARYNAIYIDGAVNNDVLDYLQTVLMVVQTGVSPISHDAIEQFQVSVSPFDVKLSGFAGGAIGYYYSFWIK